MSEQQSLRRGLDALLEAKTHGASNSDPGSVVVREMDVDDLVPGRYQPRQQLAEDGLVELADSIREQGVLQPLVVRVIEPAAAEPPAPTSESTWAIESGAGERRYEIVAGERRWRAAKLAGLETVPVLVRELSDQSALAVALIENLQREDLNPIDQARSLARLAGEFDLTHEQVGKAVGRSRASVSNLLRLLDLDNEVKALLAGGRIDMGHARALLPLDAGRQVAMARKIEKRGLSVRQVEKTVRSLLAQPESAGRSLPEIDLQTLWLQHQIARELGQQLTIRPARDGGYTLHIGFGDLAELQAALAHIQDLIGRIRATAGPRAREAGLRSAAGSGAPAADLPIDEGV